MRSFEQDASGVSFDFVADDTDAMRKQKNIKQWYVSLHKPFTYSTKEPGSRVVFIHLYLKLQSLFCTFVSSTKCSKMSFDFDSFQNG